MKNQKKREQREMEEVMISILILFNLSLVATFFKTMAQQGAIISEFAARSVYQTSQEQYDTEAKTRGQSAEVKYW